MAPNSTAWASDRHSNADIGFGFEQGLLAYSRRVGVPVHNAIYVQKYKLDIGAAAVRGPEIRGWHPQPLGCHSNTSEATSGSHTW